MLRLRTALELMTAERDRLLHELAGGQASAAVFELEDSVAASSRSMRAAGTLSRVSPFGFAQHAGAVGPGRTEPPLALPQAPPPLTAAGALRRSGTAGRPSALRLR